MNRHLTALGLALAGVGLAGCASPTLNHVLTTGVGAGGGAAIAAAASHGNPAITAAGGAGGALLGEGVNYLQTKTESKAFNSGYDQGRSDAVKAQYWMMQRQQAPPGQGTLLYPIAIPAQQIDGINYLGTTHYLPLAK